MNFLFKLIVIFLFIIPFTLLAKLTLNNSSPTYSNKKKLNSTILVYDRYLPIEEVNNSGLGQYIYSTILYGIGTMYSSITGIVASQFAWHDATYDYRYEHYNKEAVLALIPQSSIFVAFGGINQGAKSKQITTLNGLGVKQAKVLVFSGAILYGASIGVCTMNILSYTENNKRFTTSTAIANAVVLVSSYIVNSIGFFKQKTLIKSETDKRADKSNRTNKGTIIISPYVGFADKTGNAGLVMRF
jgi:hypothetical protein